MTSPLRIGLLGAGWFGREAHLANLVSLEGCTVVAASSRSEESRAAASIMVGDELQCFEDWRQLLDEVELDAVIVALTNDQHHEAAIRAFEKGAHVLCEKPLGLTLAECDEIIAAGERAGKVLQVGHEMRFQKLYVEAKRILDEDGVGDLKLLWCREFRGPMRPGWRSSEALTGGTLLEKNCHHFDLFSWFVGEKPVRVTATGGTDVLTDREILDNAQVTVEFEGGIRATLELCLFAPVGGECEIGFVGTGGRIDTRNQALELDHHRFEPAASETRTIEDDDSISFLDSSGRIDRGILPQLEHFLECCRTGATPLNDGASARMAVAICLAAQESIHTAAAVKVVT